MYLQDGELDSDNTSHMIGRILKMAGSIAYRRPSRIYIFSLGPYMRRSNLFGADFCTWPIAIEHNK